MTTNVYLVRHGQTVGNVEGRFCGHSETDLTDLGVSQARALGARLRGVRFDAVYASDLSRAAKTAAYALEHHPGTAPVLDPAFREMHYGDWESRVGREIGKENPALLADFFRCKVQAAPGGESVRQLRERTAAGLRNVLERHQEGAVMVVSHGNAIAALLSELLAMPLEATWSFQLDNTSITRLVFSTNGRLTVLGINDASHLDGLESAG